MIDILGLTGCTEVFRINKGYSSDEKFVVHIDDRKVLLRTFKIEQLDSKKKEYAILEKMQKLDVTCSRPISIGGVGGQGYMVTSYIEGADAEEEIRKYSEEDQYQIGFAAGKELRKIHHLAAQSHIAPWHSRKETKHRNYMDAYLACGMKVDHDDKIIKFIEENIHLMNGRPNLLQHDDYHVGNLIVKDKKFAGVIDFNRYDWGDPYHEFLKVGLFSREVSVPFAIGQMKGYFYESEPNEEFWRLYSLYLAMSVFSTVVWTLKTVPDTIDEMMGKVYRFLEDHDYFSEIVPRWYKVVAF